MVRAIDNPIPMPCALVVKNGSKTSLSLSGGMPGPLSEIATSAKSSRSAVQIASWRPEAGMSGHRIYRVDHQVQYDLLNLNSVATDRQRWGSDGSAHINLPRSSLTGKKINRLLDDFVEFDRLYLKRRFLEQTPQTLNDFARTHIVPSDVGSDFPNFADVRHGRLEHQLQRFNVCKNGSKGLVHLVRNRCSHFTGRRKAIDMGKLGHALSRLKFSVLGTSPLIQKACDEDRLQQECCASGRNLPGMGPAKHSIHGNEFPPRTAINLRQCPNEASAASRK